MACGLAQPQGGNVPELKCTLQALPLGANESHGVQKGCLSHLELEALCPVSCKNLPCRLASSEIKAPWYWAGLSFPPYIFPGSCIWRSRSQDLSPGDYDPIAPSLLYNLIVQTALSHPQTPCLSLAHHLLIGSWAGGTPPFCHAPSRTWSSNYEERCWAWLARTGGGWEEEGALRAALAMCLLQPQTDCLRCLRDYNTQTLTWLCAK